jgi:hypothetical protein
MIFAVSPTKAGLDFYNISSNLNGFTRTMVVIAGVKGHRGAAGSSGLPIIPAVQVGDQTRSAWLPAQFLARDCAGPRHILSGEHTKPVEMRLGIFGLNADYRHLQPAAERRRNRRHRYSFFVDSVVDYTRPTLG